MSQRELVRRCQRDGWGSPGTITEHIKGLLVPRPAATEHYADALGVSPDTVSDDRPALQRANAEPNPHDVRRVEG